MEEKHLIKYAVKVYLDELYSNSIYKYLATRYVHDKKFSEKLNEIAKKEKEHAVFWRCFLKSLGIDISQLKPSKVKLFLIKILSRFLRLGLTLKLLERGEREAIEIYMKILENFELSDEIKTKIKSILEEELIHENELIEEKAKFKEFLNYIRDAVLGMNDGLVEILSISAGLAGAYGNPIHVAIGGLIVAIGGSISMGLGVYAGVKAQKEVRVGIINRVASAVKYASLALIKRFYKKLIHRGFSKNVIDLMIKDLERNKSLLKNFAIKEEYGLKEETLENPIRAGVYTGLFYIIGSLFPLIPYFLMLPISTAILISFILAGVLLGLTGSIIALSADLDIKKKSFEMIIIGLGAATITYLIGLIASTVFGIKEI